MAQRENNDSRLIFVQRPRVTLGAVLWLVPVLAAILILILTLYGRKYRKSDGSADTPIRLAEKECATLINPLRLTALHFESLTAKLMIPQETLTRHFALLKKVGPYRTLAMVNKKEGVIISAGTARDKSRFAASSSSLAPTPRISPLLKKRKIVALQISIPLKPVAGEPHWLVATVDAMSITANLPRGIMLRYKKKGTKMPIHAAAPNLTLEVAPMARPIWPLLIGELMLAVGIALLLIAARRRE